jgi:hypothetical protein
LAHAFEVSLRVPHRYGGSGCCREQARRLVFGEVPVERLAKLKADWHESLLVAFAIDPQNEVIDVHILASEAQQLVYPKASVKRSEADHVNARFIPTDRPELHYSIHLLLS